LSLCNVKLTSCKETWLWEGERLGLLNITVGCIVSSAIALNLLSSGKISLPRSGLSFRLNSEHLSASLAKHKSQLDLATESRCTSGSGLDWCRNSKPVPISAAILNLSCQERGGEPPRQKRRSAILLAASAASMAALDLAFSFSASANAASSANCASCSLRSSSNFQRCSSTACYADHIRAS
ncbi:hypothetical protein CFP56_002535, partial [Quercus suber]